MHTFWFDKRFYAAILMGMAVCAVADAQGISATSALRLGDSPERDFQLTVHARKALSDKTELAHLNLGIRVRQGVVTISMQAETISSGLQCWCLMRYRMSRSLVSVLN